MHRRRRYLFPTLVAVDGLLAVVAGIGAAPPADVPSYALDSAIVYGAEVGLALFFAGYLATAAVVLAIEGRTLGKISTSGIELPHDLPATMAKQQEFTEALEAIQPGIAASEETLYREIEALWAEVSRLRGNIARKE